MTITTPEVDTTTIEHLDHQPACQVYVDAPPAEEQCGAPADWFLIFRQCLCGDPETDSFACDPCWQVFVENNTANCHTCGRSYSLNLMLIRAERL